MKSLAVLLFALIPVLSVSAKIVTRTVPYEHDGVELEGYLAYDDALGRSKRPGVLIMPEWWGLNNYVKGRAEKVAQLGYVAFVADMYGAGQSTTDAKKAGELAGQFYGKPLMATRARAALDQLASQPDVDAQYLAAIGYCFGGAVAQSLAYSGAPLVGIVSFHGSLIPASAEAAQHNRAKFLICHGAVDPFISANDLAAFLKSMDDGKFDYQFNRYANAVHAFTNPDADQAAANGLKGVGYNATADRRSWENMKTFLAEVFAQK